MTANHTPTPEGSTIERATAPLVEGFSISEAASLLGLEPAQISAAVQSGLITPAQATAKELRLSFRDIASLRAAYDLVRQTSLGAVCEAASGLREWGHGLSDSVGARLIVGAGRLLAADHLGTWEPSTGQGVIDFGAEPRGPASAPNAVEAESGGQPARPAVDSTGRILRFPEPAPARSTSAEDWFATGYTLELNRPEEAMAAYRRALDLDPAHVDARLELGRLLHQSNRLSEAEACYRSILERHPEHVTTCFNLGVVLEDRGRLSAALDAYEATLRLDPRHADAHFNAAHVCETLERPRDALRHLSAYRLIVRGSGD